MQTPTGPQFPGTIYRAKLQITIVNPYYYPIYVRGDLNDAWQSW